MHVAGYVLVGGRSSRMGHDKARLRLPAHHLLLVESVAAKVQKVAGNVTLIGNSAAYRDLALECLPDLPRGIGVLVYRPARAAGAARFVTDAFRLVPALHRISGRV